MLSRFSRFGAVLLGFRERTMHIICFVGLIALVGIRLTAQSCTTPSSGAVIHAEHPARVFVNAGAGTDQERCGANTSPCKSITYALAQAAEHTVSEVIVDPGIYREAISLPSIYNEGGQKTLVIRATKVGTAIVDGADVWPDWSSNGNGIYSKSWPYKWGYAAQPFASTGGPSLSCIGLRREMVFVNGVRLTQQLQGPLTSPGTFFVTDGQSDPSGMCSTLSGNPTMSIYPPTGTVMATSKVEVAVRGALITTPNGASNLELDGLTVQHANTPANNVGWSAIHISGADKRGLGSNILLKNVTSRRNNWTGFYSSSNGNMTIRDSIFTENGDNGLTVQQSKNFLFSDNTVSFNNWRASASCPKCTGWDMQGAKFLNGHGVEVDYSTFTDNLAGGLWFDFDNVNICIQNSVFARNLTNGMFIEASPGPVLIYRDRIFDNRGNGLQTANSINGTVRQSTIYGNGGAAFYIGGQATPRPVRDWETDTKFSLLAEDWIFDGVNFATDFRSGSTAYLLGTSLDTILPFTSTIWSDYNDWYASADRTPFHIAASQKTFLQWKSMIGKNGFTPGQESDSIQTAVTSDALPAIRPCFGRDCPGSPKYEKEPQF